METLSDRLWPIPAGQAIHVIISPTDLKQPLDGLGARLGEQCRIASV